MSEETPPVAADEPAESIVEPAAEAGPGDEAFVPTLDPEILSFGETKPQALVCGWCNAPLPAADLERCPNCDANLQLADETIAIPGVTTLSEGAAHLLELAQVKRQREAARRGEVMYAALSGPSVAPVPAPAEAEIEAALRPPDDEVRRVMRELEDEARRLAAAVEPPLHEEPEAPLGEAPDNAAHEAAPDAPPPEDPALPA